MANDMQQLMKRSTIEFSDVALNLRTTESLLKYIAKNLPADISYHTSSFANLSRHPLSGKLRKERGTIKITGTIRDLVEPVEFDAFETINWRDSSMVSGIRFGLIPGYDSLNDYASGTMKLWDKVRAETKNYFAEKQIFGDNIVR